MMRNIYKLAIAALILSVTALPAAAQNYHYNYGNSRVVNQSQVGYSMHESTYIPTGAINNTAKGVTTGGIGQEANPLLPGVKWGRTVGTSGDNFYLGAAPDKYKTAVPTYAQAMQQTPQKTITVDASGRRVIQQPVRQMYRGQQQQPVQQGFYYQPGQNGGAANYENTNTGVGVNFNSGGAASYSTNNNKNY